MPHSAWPPQGLLNLLEVVWNLTLLLQLPESKWEGRVAVYMHILYYIYLCVCVCAFFSNIHTITINYIHMYDYVYMCMCVCTLYTTPKKKWKVNWETLPQNSWPGRALSSFPIISTGKQSPTRLANCQGSTRVFQRSQHYSSRNSDRRSLSPGAVFPVTSFSIIPHPVVD